MCDADRVREIVNNYERRLRRGEKTTLSELCRDCPALLDAVRSEWERRNAAAMDDEAGTVCPVTPALGGSAIAEEQVAKALPRHGRFQLRRFHARGGIGEVFVAEDEEIHRNVAFKRIQPRFIGDADLRRRFVQEAEITGQLEHPGIVPIYGLIHDADGQPYYAMRFIEGESLQAAIKRLHGQPASDTGQRLFLRQLLASFVTVCKTMAYAHSRGVVHRDLKPANVMLGKYGETLVVDWGMAKEVVSGQLSVVSGAEAVAPAAPGPESTDATPLPSLHYRPSSPAAIPPPDACQAEPQTMAPSTPEVHDGTRMGDIRGTPSFMAPEQAAGQWENVGPRSDIYSLGATLYALLTGRPPLEDPNAAIVLANVQTGEFPPPRKVKADVPKPLEAICLNAMALVPEKRYPSAQELADDVEHWLADEPVRAYRDPWTGRLRRWVRRHRGAASGLAATVLLAIGFFAVLAGVLQQQKGVLAEKNAALETAKGVAEDRFDLAESAVQKYLTTVSDNKKLKEGPWEELRRELLKAAVPFYEELKKQKPEDERQEVARGNAFGRLGRLQHDLGEHQAARDSFETAQRVFNHLVQARPENRDYRVRLAESHQFFGQELVMLGKLPDARREFQVAVELITAVVRAEPTALEPQQVLANCRSSLGDLALNMGERGEAEQELLAVLGIYQSLIQAAPSHRDYRRLIAHAHNNLGVFYARIRQYDRAEAQFRTMLELDTALVRDFPDVPEYRVDQAQAQSNLGSIANIQERYEEAEQLLRGTISTREEIVRRHPAVPSYRRDLAASHGNLASALAEQNKVDEAIREFETSNAILAALAKDHADVPQYRNELAGGFTNLGMNLENLGRPATEWEKSFRAALQVMTDLVRDFPGIRNHREVLAAAHTNVAWALERQERFADAEQEYCAALEVQNGLVREYPADFGYGRELGGYLGKFGNMLQKAGRHAEGLAKCDEAVAILEPICKERPDYVFSRTALCETLQFRAKILQKLNRPADAVADWAKAVQLAPEQEHPNIRRHQAFALAQSGDIAAATKLAEESTQGGDATPGALYDVACIFAVAAKETKSDKPRQERYARRAVELLNQIKDTGFFNVKAQIENLVKDADLDALRQRDDFKKLVAEVTQK